MWHVDDGTLHAYLDGALDALPAAEGARVREHLAGCAQCARRLEEERALRAEASDILAGAVPGPGDLPSLEELRARRTGAPVSAGARLRRLGWAASIVVAAGAGWLLRGSRLPLPPPPGGDAPPAALDEARGSGEAAVGEVATQAARPAEAREEAPAEVMAASTSPSADAGGEEAPAVSSGAAASAPGGETLRQGRTGGMAALEDSLLARMGEARVAPEPLEAKAVEPLVAQVRERPAPPSRDSASTDRAALPDRSASTQAAARLRSDAVASEELARRRAVQTISPADAPSPAVGGAAATLSPAGPLAVPGLPVLSVSRAESGLPPGSVRVLQLLEGDTLEVLHLPASGSRPDPSRPEADDRTQVVLPLGEGWVVGRARLPARRLVELLERIGGGR